MGQTNRATLIYALVSRGTPPVVLVEYAAFSGNFNSIACQCLHKLPSSDNKFTYNCDDHTVNYFVHDGFRRQFPLAFLDRIKDDLETRYGGGKAAELPANSLNEEYGPKLKELMQFCIEHPDEICKLGNVKAQVSEVKGVMMANIDKVVDRGERIELLVDKTESLLQQARDFSSIGTRVHRKMWLQNTKIKLVVLAVVIALILIMVFSACKGFDCGT